jgi:hypothetical protein
MADPPITLIVNGARIQPHRVSGTFSAFRLRLPATSVRLVSRAAVPATLGISDDRRRLGFCVHGLCLAQGARVFDIPLRSETFLDGFHPCEEDRFRWTSGDALLPPEVMCGFEGEVELTVNGYAMETYGDEPGPDAPDHATMARFESIGQSCEVAFAQNHYRVDTAGLLRWAGIDVHGLTEALRARFEGVGHPANTELVWFDEVQEYRVRDTRWFFAHTGVGRRFTDPADEERFRLQTCARLRLQRRRLLAEIVAATKILIFACRDPSLGEDTVLALHGAVRAIGPATLFVVRIARLGEPAGDVRVLRDGLLLGTIDRFVGPDGPYTDWLKLCGDALALTQAAVPA